MNIGFDGKRAFHNTTGLGYYSRNLVTLLARQYPEHAYFLFNPAPSSKFSFTQPNIREIRPTALAAKIFTAAWRSKWVTSDLRQLGIQLYHGLSHEIPIGISRTGIPSVVTIHDLIHERYPQQYNRIDLKIYTRKYTYACKHADKVIAISQQTKDDLVQYYAVDPAKIEVCYQSSDPVYATAVSTETKQAIAKKYALPAEFILSVGTINERKNLLNVCKAMFLLRNEISIPPLIVIGKGKGTYYQSVKDFVLQNGLDKSIIFLSEDSHLQNQPGFLSTTDLAAIYQLSTLMIYPSFFEGFGLPVLEALNSGIPVITSNVSCMPEVGGDAVYYVNPNSAEEMAEGIRRIVTDDQLASTLRTKAKQQAARFSEEQFASSIMNVYKSIW